MEFGSQSFPPRMDNKPEPQWKAQNGVVTGSTGSLGSRPLTALLVAPSVEQVVCLDRDSDGDRVRYKAV